MNRSRKVGAAALTIFAMTLTLVAQTLPKLRVDTELVQVPVTVTDADNRYITDLKREHFRVWEDRIEQKILFFSREEAPMSLVIVLDVSASMGNQRWLADKTAEDCLKTGDLQDEYALILFSDRADPPTEFTDDLRELQSRLLFLHSKGRSAVYDGVYNAIATLKTARNPRKAIVIISDGDENHSRRSMKDLRTFVREKDVQIFTFGNYVKDGLTELAQTTGGAAIQSQGTIGKSGLANICSTIVRELKNQYVISYKSTNQAKDGTWRKIRIDLTLPAELELHARSKTGYLASPEN